MENLNKLLTWLSKYPVWVRSVILALLCALLVFLTITSCGTPKTTATVQNVSPNGTVTVTMSISNNTSSTPSVNTSIPLNGQK